MEVLCNTQHATRKVITFLVIASFLFLISLSFQSCQEATAPDIKEETNQIVPNKKSSVELNDLNSIAKTLANSLSKSSLFSVIENDVSSSTKNEQIVDGLEFFTKERNAGVLNKTTATNVYDEILNTFSLKKTSKAEAAKFTNAVEKLDEGKVDIYFPVKGHYEKWLENKDELLIGFMDDEHEFAPVTVYNLEGNSFKLSAKKTPDVPVLMVNTCEHGGIHDEHHSLSKGKKPGGGSGGGSGNTTKDRRIYFEWIGFDDWHKYEPWGSGDPEFVVYWSIPKIIDKSDFSFGDEYGYWKAYWYFPIPTYKARIPHNGWNHKHQYLTTIHKNDIEKSEYRYIGVYIVEEDKDIGKMKISLNVTYPLSVDGKTNAKAVVEWEIPSLHDKVGKNNGIKLWGTPYHSDRTKTPAKSESSRVGGAYVTIWWK